MTPLIVALHIHAFDILGEILEHVYPCTTLLITREILGIERCCQNSELHAFGSILTFSEHLLLMLHECWCLGAIRYQNMTSSE